ncbi:hypothetical protein HBI81_185220 [Parastagonospora nodorum]|nr:hypothetical protein HBH46_174080 [Parastagonospora nodorum]KAH4957360.1 hypothetical protein HBI78_189880 [Parastagonospora nodorum]KAH5469213.1 hypothetical protein HBI31_197340 [Parastagonospora nodorum]KAH5716660.1 hypothetical protein HBI18_181370 [Parastagonospora nodorum]KAH6330380.1 hypothetical protein HBI37_188390 [Parastagonospora nodorum]
MESQKAEAVTQDATNTKALHGVSSMVTVIELDSHSAPRTQLTDYEQNSESTLDVNISSPGQYSMQLDEVQPTRNQAPPRLDSEVSAAVQVLRIIESYGQHKDISYQWKGIASYAPIVATQIRAGKPVRILFTGFGFKSPLVLGRLPDLGEKLALAHLDGLCSNIATVYEVGAEVHVCSDGLLYNDLFSVSDQTVRCYVEGLRQIVDTNELRNIHIMEAGGSPGRKLVSHGFPPRDYSGSRTTPANVNVQPSLRTRQRTYMSAIIAKETSYVHLTSYDTTISPGSDVLTVSLLPQEAAALSLAPWESVVVIENDGRYRTTAVNEVQDNEAYEVVLGISGAPSHYRAKADMWDWKDDGTDVTFEHLYPTGTIIRPGSSYTGNAPSIQALPMRKVRKLAQNFSPIVLRGFSETTNEDYFLAKGNELGEILTWTFGQILKVKDTGEVDKNANNVTSNEAMPMHFDGIFKFIDTVDPVTGEVKKVMTPPRYQYFTCLSTAPKGDGYTLFANSHLFFQNLPSPFTLERLEKATWSMVNDGFWSAKQTGLPLVVRHKDTGAACLRWHQPWTETNFSKYYIEIENDEAADELVSIINRLVYDYRVCLRFEWEQGDLLINDNVSMLHTRTAFAGACEREMWRIHFD